MVDRHHTGSQGVRIARGEFSTTHAGTPVMYHRHHQPDPLTRFLCPDLVPGVRLSCSKVGSCARASGLAVGSRI